MLTAFRMAAPPRLNQHPVPVGSGSGGSGPREEARTVLWGRRESGFENAASNTRSSLTARRGPEGNSSSPGPRKLLPSSKKEQPGSASHPRDDIGRYSESVYMILTNSA